MKHLTIRNVPEPLARRLEEARRAHGRSLNQTVLDLLAQALGVAERRNGLRELAGAWSAEEHASFEAAVADLEQLDGELWR
jgi:plasmid stability protein